MGRLEDSLRLYREAAERRKRVLGPRAQRTLDTIDGLAATPVDIGLPVPKWQQRCTRDRVTTQRLVQLLRQEVWGNAIDQIAPNTGCDDFVTPEVPDTKSPDMILAPAPPLAYARTG